MEGYFVLGILGFVLSIVVLLTFFSIASRLADIRKEVRLISQYIQAGRTYIEAYRDGEIREIQGRKMEALELYQEALYRFNKLYPNNNHPKTANEHKQRIEEKILELKG